MSSELAAGKHTFRCTRKISPYRGDRPLAIRCRSAPSLARTRVSSRKRCTTNAVQIDRIPIGHQVDAVPPVRQEGDTTIFSVEEIIIVERRLILKEEVHIRRLHVAERHREAVILRKREAVITRIERTGHADLPHPALGQDVTPSPTTRRAQVGSGV